MSDRSFAELLRFYREQAGISQARLARLVQVDHSHVSRLERGERRPSRTTVLQLSEALGLRPHERDALLTSAGFPPAADPDLVVAATLLADDQVPAWVKETVRNVIRAMSALAERERVDVQHRGTTAVLPRSYRGCSGDTRKEESKEES